MPENKISIPNLHVRTLARNTAHVPRHIAIGFFKFLSKNNVVQLSIAVVMGTAFNAIVNSIVLNVINPIIGLMGTSNLENWYVPLKGYNGTDYPSPLIANQNKVVTLNLGAVGSSIITFIIVSSLCFLLAKTLQKYLHENFKDDDKSECCYCFELVKIQASICPHCQTNNPLEKTELKQALELVDTTKSNKIEDSTLQQTSLDVPSLALSK